MKTLSLWKTTDINQIDRLFDNFFVQKPLAFSNLKQAEGKSEWLPPLDSIEKDHQFEVAVEVAGIPEDQVKLTITDDVLVIKGEKNEVENAESTFYRKERRFGNFQRAISLPQNLHTNQARADFNNGLLVVIIPKAEAVKPKEIEIQVS